MDFDRAYANGPFIPDADAFPPRWEREAAAFREGLGPRAQLGIAYGGGPRQKLDLLWPDTPPLGLLAFVHGGYWLKFGRESWSHLAAGALARGWACAIPSYTLAPDARIREMTLEIVGAVEAAARLVAGPVVVTGHSAGGHLSARLGCADLRVDAAIRRVVPISPLADLEPIALTKMNEQLRLDAAEIEAESPARKMLRAGVSAHVFVGAEERPAFLYQARLLSESWRCPWTSTLHRHHFNVIEALTDPASPLIAACLE
jgi:arylformamidase